MRYDPATCVHAAPGKPGRGRNTSDCGRFGMSDGDREFAG